MSNYTPLHVYSHYSVGRGLANPKEIAAYAKKLGMNACALTDINNMAGCIEFYKACQKEKIKPIIGCTIMTEQGSIVLIALNKSGYNELLKITADLNSGKDYLELAALLDYDLDNLIGIVGYEDSVLYRNMVSNFKIDENLNPAFNLMLELRNKFSDNNLFIDIQFSECDKLSSELKEKYKEVAGAVQFISSPRVYYLEQDDKELHKILLSVSENESLDDMNKINHKLYKFFDGYKYYMPPAEEILTFSNEEALQNTNKIADLVEDYQLAKPASIPEFKCPKNEDTEKYFRELCVKGFQKKLHDKLKKHDAKREYYYQRIEHEISVLKEANLFNYFLILRDIITYAKDKGYLVGPGRGSVAGCLVAYLLDIHQIDSIKYDLIFERFYNKGRAGSLPDIDTDFPKRCRGEIIKYITKKYGKENVMLIATYSTLMGRAALKAVFRANKNISFSEQNDITKNIVDKARISDELQEMEEPSVIRWCLENKADELSAWCSIDDKGVLHGPLSKEFEQAIKLEGVICNASKHAAGVVIGPEPLRNLVPIIYDNKDKQQIIACQMNELEFIGLVKLDCLSLSTLDRLEDVNEI